MIEQKSFAIYTFGEAIENLKCGYDIERGDLRLRLLDNTIMMVIGKEILAPWLATHKDILAKDWRVIRFE